MAERLVINTGPLIALAGAGALEVVTELPVEMLSPEEVRAELDEGARSGHAVVPVARIRFVKLTAPLDAVALAELGPGEAAVIRLALEQGITTVAIDERKGRRAALAVGLRVTGSLGLLGRAKVLGLVPIVRPYVERLRGAGWFDAKLLAEFLAGLGE